MVNFPRPRALRRPGQSVLRNNTVFIGLPRGDGGSSSGPPSPPVSPANPPVTVTYVAPNGSDTTGQRGNPLAPFLTLQAAVNAALDGDTIVVASGSYPTPWGRAPCQESCRCGRWHSRKYLRGPPQLEPRKR
jgi:hypothetical protein